MLYVPSDKINDYSHSTNFESQNSHSTNANFDQFRHITRLNITKTNAQQPTVVYGWYFLAFYSNTGVSVYTDGKNTCNICS